MDAMIPPEHSAQTLTLADRVISRTTAIACTSAPP